MQAEDRGSHIEMRISDVGPGIPPEVADKLMTPFFTTKPPGQGTGLGLSIAQLIISEHGGTLTLDRSAPNTSFVISLPKAQEMRNAA